MRLVGGDGKWKKIAKKSNEEHARMTRARRSEAADQPSNGANWIFISPTFCLFFKDLDICGTKGQGGLKQPGPSVSG